MFWWGNPTVYCGFQFGISAKGIERDDVLNFIPALLLRFQLNRLGQHQFIRALTNYNLLAYNINKSGGFLLSRKCWRGQRIRSGSKTFVFPQAEHPFCRKQTSRPKWFLGVDSDLQGVCVSEKKMGGAWDVNGKVSLYSKPLQNE